jgi:hypothetical protein
MPVHLSDTMQSTDAAFAVGVIYAVDHGADVISFSAGGPDTQLKRDAVAYALERGVPVVAAAGNAGPGVGITYPAGIPGVIAVGSTNSSDERSTFSQTGSELDIVAPGEYIATWTLDGRDNMWKPDFVDGTSFSAPLVAGVVALMLSVNPTMTPQSIEATLRATAQDLGPSGWDASFGAGLVDARAAVDASRPTTTTTRPTTTTTRPPTTTTKPSGQTFPDVPSSHPYAVPINDLAARGVISGYDNGYFGPDDPVKRQQFAKLIVLTLGRSAAESDISPFDDVEPTGPGVLYPDHYVAVAAALGITEGTSPGEYSPYREITRAQLITMVGRAAGLADPPAEYSPPFADFSDTHYPWARRAAYAGLLDGLQGIGPDYDFWAPATRGEVSAILFSLLHR